MTETRARIVIIGAGFGGLKAARELAGKPVDVFLIDRNNFHTFTPLLYQVATCSLDPSEIAYPVRSIFRKQNNIRFLLGTVVEIETDRQIVHVQASGDSHEVPYDYLIVAAGAVTNFLGKADLEQFAFGLKDLFDALALRNHVLKMFEKAAWTEDEADRAALTTLVVVGGGPTGLETAGALFELYNFVLRREFDNGHQIRARVVLVEALDTLLLPYPKSLQRAAKRQLEGLGVEVILGKAVEHVGVDHVRLKDGQEIRTHTLVWAAGVKGSPLAETVGIELQRGGRLPVERTLRVIGLDKVYAIGDIAWLTDAKGSPYPQVIPVAQQQGVLAARNIMNRIQGQPEKFFRYRDKGIMATIGRRRAVAWPFYTVKLTGFVAWITWLALHLIWLLGFRNRLNVLVNWVWNYLTYDRSVRIIVERDFAARDRYDVPAAIEQRREPALEADGIAP